MSGRKFWLHSITWGTDGEVEWSSLSKTTVKAACTHLPKVFPFLVESPNNIKWIHDNSGLFDSFKKVVLDGGGRFDYPASALFNREVVIVKNNPPMYQILTTVIWAIEHSQGDLEWRKKCYQMLQKQSRKAAMNFHQLREEQAFIQSIGTGLLAALT